MTTTKAFNEALRQRDELARKLLEANERIAGLVADCNAANLRILDEKNHVDALVLFLGMEVHHAEENEDFRCAQLEGVEPCVGCRAEKLLLDRGLGLGSGVRTVLPRNPEHGPMQLDVRRVEGLPPPQATRLDSFRLAMRRDEEKHGNAPLQPTVINAAEPASATVATLRANLDEAVMASQAWAVRATEAEQQRDNFRRCFEQASAALDRAAERNAPQEVRPTEQEHRENIIGGCVVCPHDWPCPTARAERNAPPEGCEPAKAALVDPEHVAAAVHDEWMRHQRARGLTTRLFHDGTEMMVPFVELSEAAKDLDRATVATVLRALASDSAAFGKLPVQP